MRAGEPGCDCECSIIAGLLPVRACVGAGLVLGGGDALSAAAADGSLARRA